MEQYQVGQRITTNIFKPGDLVDVTGNSLGKGFAGVMKRHNMHGFPMTRGTHEYRRHIGSVGCRFPQHILRGHRMPGHMGDARVTVQNLKVVAVREPDNVLLIEGAVPGYPDNYLVIKKALKREPKAVVVKPVSAKPKQEKKAKPGTPAKAAAKK
jgi:large subunit ribosomal protein L3